MYRKESIYYASVSYRGGRFTPQVCVTDLQKDARDNVLRAMQRIKQIYKEQIENAKTAK